MREIAKFLFKIDEIIFDRKEVQYFLLGFFITIIFGHLIGFFTTSRLSTWIEIGLIAYICLFAYRFATNKNELENMKKMYNSKGVFPFVKGFTYSLLLGPIGLLLAIFLAMLPKSEKGRNEDEEK